MVKIRRCCSMNQNFKLNCHFTFSNYFKDKYLCPPQKWKLAHYLVFKYIWKWNDSSMLSSPFFIGIFLVWIQVFVKGGPASEAESYWCDKAYSHEESKPLVARVEGPLKETFWFLMLKYAFSYILGTLFLSCLTASSTSKTDKNRQFYGISADK